ncbi:MAG: ABC transporter ATP-binding protein [Candidatus Hydrogenedentes bacterium]|nr:ABC transporter ATP-binding protein [Candidatus Hydrogenedentota bacterium]
MPIIEVDNVSKFFPLHRQSKIFLGRGGPIGRLLGKKNETFAAVSELTLEVEAGESVGLIGRNGSGKSTLLKLLAGVTLPSEGTVRVGGRVASLLELGAGFHPMLTGRENVYLNAGILGMRHAQVDKVIDSIIEFSGIGDFIDQTVDTYSSGMYVRIAFSVAVHVNPDIFLVDEVLAVGDEEFQRKCRTMIGSLREQGKTIVFVSHDLGTVHALCDRVVLLHHGKMISRGTPQTTIDYYLRQVGHEGGIHTMASGAVEALFSHGRITVFKDQKEITTAGGLCTQILVMGTYHESTSADWQIVDRTPTSCTAVGTMSRLPVTLHCTVWIDGGNICARWSWKQSQELSVEAVYANCFLPASYTRWYYGLEKGEFPVIQPDDLDWSIVVSPVTGCLTCTILAGDDVACPPVHVDWQDCPANVSLRLDNTNYLSNARVAHLVQRIPSTGSPLPAGEYAIGTLTITPGYSRAALDAFLQAYRESQTIVMNGYDLILEHGAVQIFSGKTPITQSIHFQTQMLVAGLWNVSQTLKWSRPQATGRGIGALGESLRFPYHQEWELWQEADGCHFRCTLIALEPLETDEYNIAIGLAGGYDHWETPHETGTFTEFVPGLEEWKHLNRDYKPGATLAAWGVDLPRIGLKLLSQELEFHPTVINTGFTQSARVLQFIRTPGRQSHLEFNPGRHLLGEFVLTVEPPHEQ